MKKVFLKLCLYASLVGFTTDVFADGVQTYICIEQKSVGWERKDNGEYNSGNFKVDDKRFFIKYTPLSLDDKGELKNLPKIEVVTDSSSVIYDINSCNFIFLDEFRFGMMGRNYQSKKCEKVIERAESFGDNGSQYEFIPNMRESPNTTTFTSAKIGLSPMFAYLNMGTCILSN